ncbi:MAG: SGNH/GDSL hydrolase family protein [Acidobacteria bacterium]|nr:SGNH/GDSL hydrolase family protein [Acidobacteriota bacterium]
MTNRIKALGSRRARQGLRLVVLGLAFVVSALAMAQKPVSLPEEIEWTWEVRPPRPNPTLPNVLLLGDSITRNYFPEVQKRLTGIANVYLMASSTSVGDPRIEQQIEQFVKMEKVRFRVVHFNNGMHGWAYSEQQYKREFPAFLRAIRSLVKNDTQLIWASTTPVKSDTVDGATNSRVEERNRIALEFVRPQLAIDDQFSLMRKHSDLYQDTVHFNPAGAAIQGDQAAEMIRSALSRRD